MVKPSIKYFLKRIYFRYRIAFRALCLFQAKLMFSSKFIQSRIEFGYFPGEIIDGLGAQLQRVIAIRGLAYYLGVKIHNMRISDVALHPLDGLNKREYREMLSTLNSILDCETHELSKDVWKVDIDELYLRHFFYSILTSLRLKSVVRLCIRNPYYLVDAKPNLYRLGISPQLIIRLKSLAIDDYSNAIVLHHRQGVGNMAVQPGQKSPRELELNSYLIPLREALDSSKLERVVIFTDAPETDFIFIPPEEQNKLWVGLPKFENGEMRVSKSDFMDLLEFFPQITLIRRGGNPLVSLAEMSTAGALILSRSSFGYLAALFLESSNIWIPQDFWHPKFPSWSNY